MSSKNRSHFSSIQSIVEATSKLWSKIYVYFINFVFLSKYCVEKNLCMNKEEMDSKEDLNDAFIASTCDELILLDLSETEFTLKEMPR